MIAPGSGQPRPPPGMRWDALDADVDMELQLRILCFPGFIPSSEVEDPSTILDAVLPSRPLPETLLREDDQILLWVVLDYLEVLKGQAKLGPEGVTDVVWLRVMAIPLEPAHCRLADQRIPAPLDAPRGGDEHLRTIRTRPGIAGVRRHRRWCWVTACRLQVGAARVSG